MPRGDGTGPAGGNGPGSGRRMGMGRAGRGRNNGPSAAGPGGECICTQCGRTLPHQQDYPCMQIKCPQCGSPMTRK